MRSNKTKKRHSGRSIVFSLVWILGAFILFSTIFELESTLQLREQEIIDDVTNAESTHAESSNESDESDDVDNLIVTRQVGVHPLKAPECDIPDGMRSIRATDSKGRRLFRMVVHAGYDFISNKLTQAGFWEIDRPQAIADLAPGHASLPKPEDGLFLDIGANVGFYSLLFAHHGYDVIAVEPLSTNIKALQTSLCLNPHFSMTIIQAGLSDHKALCHLVAKVSDITKTRYLNAIGEIKCPRDGEVLEDCHVANDAICEKVRVTTLDALFTEERSANKNESNTTISLSNTSIAIVKMDIEGHEETVLRGGLTWLEKQPPLLIQYEGAQTTVGDLLSRHYFKVGSKRGHDGNTVAIHDNWANSP